MMISGHENKGDKIKCLVCGNSNTSLIYENMSGYEAGTYFNIFKCNCCKSHFINEKDIDYTIYDKIYANTDKTITYRRYQQYFNEIKSEKNKLEYLCDKETIPLILKFYLNKLKGNRHQISILDIGCGLGYTTYALNESGFNCLGLDISEESIDRAKKKFGNYYLVGDANKLGEQKEYKGKYDIVFATELIEHISDVSGFIDNIAKFLKPGGALILTTPNKDYMPNKCVWFSDTPPVHTSLIGLDFFKQYATKNGLKLSIFNYNKYIKNKNMLLNTFLERKWMSLNHEKFLREERISFNDEIKKEVYDNQKNTIKQRIYLFLNNRFFSYLSYLICQILPNSTKFYQILPNSTLGIILKKG